MAEITCFVLDVDGVLTDGRLRYGGCTEPMRSFHVHDGLAMRAFVRIGGRVAIITGKQSLAVEQRAAELGIGPVVQAARDKGAEFDRLLQQLDLSPDQVAVVGDDLPDLPMLRRCGYPLAVADAAEEVRAVARYVTQRRGGRGAVREALEHVLRRDGRWQQIVELFDPQADPAAARK